MVIEIKHICNVLFKTIQIHVKDPWGLWLVWLSGLGVVLQTEKLLDQFPVRAHAWVAGQVYSLGCARGNHTLMFLCLSFSLSSPLSKNNSIQSFFLNLPWTKYQPLKWRQKQYPWLCLLPQAPGWLGRGPVTDPICIKNVGIRFIMDFLHSFWFLSILHYKYNYPDHQGFLVPTLPFCLALTYPLGTQYMPAPAVATLCWVLTLHQKSLWRVL